MGRSKPGGEKERQLARKATKVPAAGRRGRGTPSLRLANVKRKETSPGQNRPIYTKPVWNRTRRRLRARWNFYPWIPKGFGAFVRDGSSENSSTSYSAFTFLTSLINVICNLFCWLTLRLSTNMTIICSQLLSSGARPCGPNIKRKFSCCLRRSWSRPGLKRETGLFKRHLSQAPSKRSLNTYLQAIATWTL